MHNDPKLLGLYCHIPFCKSKCAYCDFYSENFSKTTADLYTQAVITAINSYNGLSADTLYFGGGTPNLIGSQNIKKIVDAAKNIFTLENAEITMEANPESLSKQDISPVDFVPFSYVICISCGSLVTVPSKL